jgi:signal transduction histidine kinase
MVHERGEAQAGWTILIAEDNESLAAAMAETLDLQGLKTVLADDGEHALVMAHTLQPDLILLDVTMPGISGLEVCERLKSDPALSSIPVIFVTAKAEHADRLRGMAAGATGYLTKPFSPTQLIALVDKVLGGHSFDPVVAQPGPADLPTDQLVVYARELKELVEQERRKRQALEEAYQRLGELDRLKAAFVGAVTHELLTPFANIGLPLQVLLRQSESFSSEQKETLDELATELSQLHRLINGVVKFAGLVNRQRDPRPVSVLLSQIVPPAVGPVALLAQSRAVDLRVWASHTLPPAYADPELLTEAIFQMSHNAVKFNVPGGAARVRTYELAGHVLIEVTDTGVGLTPQQLEILGEPFQQSADALRRGQEGLGIGWTFVRYVAQVHGGWTRVESPGPNQGSTFTLALPIDANGQK